MIKLPFQTENNIRSKMEESILQRKELWVDGWKYKFQGILKTKSRI